MSSSVRGRRVTEPVLIQRGPSPFDKYEDLTSMWDQMGEVKSVLRRAERRLEDVDKQRLDSYSPVNQDFTQSKKYPSDDKTVHVDRVPGFDIGIGTFKSGSDSRSKVPRDRDLSAGKKKVTIKDSAVDPGHDFASKDSRLTSGYRSRSPISTQDTHGISEYRSGRDIGSKTYVNRDGLDWYGTGRYLGYDAIDADKARYQSPDVKDDRDRNEQNADYFSSPQYDIRSTSAIDDGTEIRVLNDFPTQYASENYPKKTSQSDYTSAYSRLYGHDAGVDKNLTTTIHPSFSDVKATRFDADGLDRVRQQIDRQRKLVTNGHKDETPSRTRHLDDDPVTYIPSADLHQSPATSVLTSKQPKVRKVASAPPAPSYKGFNPVKTKIVTPGGRGGKEGEMKRKIRTRSTSQDARKTEERALKPHKTAQQGGRLVAGPSTEEKKKLTRKVQRMSSAKDKKPHRTDRQGIITARSWREGQKVAMQILGPGPKRQTKPSPATAKQEAMMDIDDEDNEIIRKLNEIPQRAEDKQEASDDEISQHTIESDKVTKTAGLSEDAKYVLDNLQSESENSAEEDEKADKTSAKPSKSKSSKKKTSVTTKKKSKLITEPQYPTQKVRTYDSDEVRKYMAKQQADRKKKLQDSKRQQQLAEDKKKTQLDELYRKQKQSVKQSEKKKAVQRKRMDETFSKGPQHPQDLPKRHPFPSDRRRVELSGSDKENKGVWSASSSSTYSDDSILPSTPRSQSPRVITGETGHHKPTHTDQSTPKATDKHDDQGVTMEIDRTGSPLLHPGDLQGRSKLAPKTSSTDNLTIGLDRGELDQRELLRKPYSSSLTDLRYKGLSGSWNVSGRSKAERLAAIKDMASALQGRIEAEARRLAGDLEATASNSKLDGTDHWAYASGGGADSKADAPLDIPRYERITGKPSDHLVFISDLPGVGNLSSQARLASDQEKQDEAATKIQAAYRGHHVRQGLMWKLPSGFTLGDRMHGVDADRPIKSLSMGLDKSPYHSDNDSISERTLTEHSLDIDLKPQFKELFTPMDHQGIDRDQKLLDADLYRDLLPTSVNRRDYLRSSYGQPKADGYSVIDIYTKRYGEASKDPSRRFADSLGTSPADKSLSQAYIYEDDFTGGSISQSHQGVTSPVPRSHLASQRSLSKAASYSDDFTGSVSNQSKKSASLSGEKGSKDKGQTSVRRSTEKKSPRREDTLEEVSYSQSFSSSEEENQLASNKRTRTPSPRTVSSHSKSLRSKSPAVSGTKSPVPLSERRSPPNRESSDRRSPVSDRKSPVSSTLRKSPITKDYVNGFQPVEEIINEDDGEYDTRVHRPVPYGLGRPVSDVPPRLAPSALELKMAAELNLLESMEESMRQLTEVERARAVSLAQQESVSLAQILKARQQSHERELQLLSLKAKQEADEASRQLEEARKRAAEAASQAEKSMASVRKDVPDSVNDAAQKLMQSQAEAAMATAEAARQLAEARHTSMEHVAAMQKFDPTKVAAETASAAAAAAVTAALERQRQQQIEQWKEIRAKKAKQLSDYSTSSSPSRTDSRAPSTSKYSSDFTDYSSKSKDASQSSPPSYSDKYRSDRSPPKDKNISISESVKTAEDASQAQRDKDISTISSVQTAADTARSVSNGSIKTISGVSVDRENSENNGDSSIQTDPSISVAKDSSKSDSIAEEITKGSGEDYSMQFDSHTEDEIDEKSFRMLLPSESHRLHTSKGRHGSQSDHASSSDEMPLTHDSGKWANEDLSSPFSAEESFNKFTAEMVKQYMREEELRAQHQAALLRLREKALKEKTKAEMAWIEHQKKRLKDKGTDEAMPPLRKKQRGLLMKLKQEQAEIDRLKAANKAASQERKLLLYQQQEISRIRKSAQAYWGRVKGTKTAADGLKSDDDISIGLDDSVSDVPDGLSDVSSPSPVKTDKEESPKMKGAVSDNQLSASEKQAKVMQKLKKMKKQSNEKFLTRREQKLLKRKAKAEELLKWKKIDEEELLKWKKKLDEEELRVQSMEKEALRLLEEKAKAAKEGKPSDSKTKKEQDEKTKKDKDEKAAVKDSKVSEKDDSSITEEISQMSSIAEDIPSESQTDKNSFQAPTGNGFSSDDTTVTEDYANEKFESIETTAPVTSRGLSPSPRAKTPRSLNSLSIRYPLSPRTRRDEESGSEESFSMTQSETTSDLSDVEGRIAALKDALRKRKNEVERLRKQQKKRHREKLRAQEASLKKQLESYEKYIEKTKAELIKERDQDKITVKPQIKKPKAAESKRIREQTSPKQSSPDTTRDSRTSITPEKKGVDADISKRSSTDDEQSVKEATDSYTSWSATTTPATTPAPTPQPPEEMSPRRRLAAQRKERSYKEDSLSDSISIRLGDKGPEVISPRPPPPRSQSPDSRPTSRLSDVTDASEIPEDIPLSARSARSGISDFLTPRLPDIQERSDVSSENEPLKPVGKPSEPPKPGSKPSLETMKSVSEISQLPKSESEIQEELPSQVGESEIAEDILSAVSAKSTPSETVSPRISLTKQGQESVIKPADDLKQKVPMVTESGKIREPSRSPPASPAAELDKSVSPDKSQDQEQMSLSPEKFDVSESEKSVSSVRSRTQSKSYSYSEDFTSTSSPKSETEDEISEHLSDMSVPTSSEKSEGLVIDLKASISQEEYVPEKDVSEKKEKEKDLLEFFDTEKEEVEDAGKDSGSVTPVDQDRTPIASPTPQDELVDFNIGDRVLVGDKQPGTLRFKGKTSFATGFWGGVELDVPKGTNDGSINGQEYFTCEPGYGIFAPPHKLSHMPDDYRYEETESEIESIEEEMKAGSPEMKAGSPEKLSQEHGIFEEEELHRYESSESSVSKQHTIKSGVDAKKETSDADSTIDDSELERIISTSAAAVEAFCKSPQTSVDDTEHSQDDTSLPHEDEPHRQTLEDVVDSITDQLTVSVVKDTLNHVASVADKKTSVGGEKEGETKQEQTQFLDMLLIEQDKHGEQVTLKDDYKPSNKVADDITKALLTEAVGQMQAIKRNRDQKLAEMSFEDDGAITPITEIEPPSLVSGTPSPEKDANVETPPQTLSPLPRIDTPYTPSPVDMNRKEDDDEPLSDEVFAERIKVENNADDAAFPEPVARPRSPVPGESGDSLWKTLDDDFADVLGDGEWFDDDFGSMPRSNSIVKVPQRQSFDNEIQIGSTQDRLDARERSPPDIRHVELQRLTEEVFYAVPHNQKEAVDLCMEALRVFHNKQECGEPITNLSTPDSFLGSDTKGADIESVSRKAYKEMVFELTGEVFRDIYCEDYNHHRPSWMKPKRVARKYYHKPRPPETFVELESVVREQVLYLLGLQKKPQSDLIPLKWINKKKKDHVDEILTEELREEEPEWVNYDDDELAVKMQLSDSIFESLLTETVMVLSTITDRRKARLEGDDVEITAI
ncbi:centrosome-associated protein 350-like isoform X2 [Ptychodera flava]|uniref:centrosome-associated protein 350-like isoform X2 n=1 Tax=Ptychodera flava TaxID=63121 RepID=UPI00396A1AAF